MKKKVLTGILSAAMLLTTAPAAFAEGENTAADTWGYEWNYNSNQTDPSAAVAEAEGDYAKIVVGNNGNTNVGTIADGKGGLAYFPTAASYGNQSTKSYGKPSSYYGNEYNIYNSDGTQKIHSDTEILVSTDFMVPRENVGGLILAPHVEGKYDFLGAFYISLDGTMSMINGCRWGGDEGYSVKIGKVNYGEWYNLAIKYKFQTETGTGKGMRADVYLNGEKVVSDFAHAYNGGGVQSFKNSIIAVTKTNYRSMGRSVACDEGIAFDNTYIGNDFSRLPDKLQIARVSDEVPTDKKKLNVRFNQDGMRETLTASQIHIYNDKTSNSAGQVTDISWIDEREAVISLDTILAANTWHTMIIGDLESDNNIQKTFKTRLEGFWCFDDDSKNNIVSGTRNPNFKGDIIPGIDSYQSGGKGLKVYFGGATASGDGSVARDVPAVAIFSDNIANHNGPLTVSVDVMIPNNRVSAGIGVVSSNNDYLKGRVYIRNIYENGICTGTKLFVGETALVDIEIGKWYNLTVRFAELINNYTFVDAVYLDGVSVLSDPVLLGGTDTMRKSQTNRIMLVASPVKSPAGRLTDEFAYYDNLYIGPDLNYLNSKASYENQDMTWTVSAGAVKNEGCLIVALYDSNHFLKDVDFVNYELDPTEKMTFKPDVAAPTGEDTMKTFIWDSLSGLRPYKIPNDRFVTDTTE